MMRQLRLALASVMMLGIATAACTGPAGQDGKDAPGTPSVSAIIPSFAYLGHTLDLTISGNETNWNDKTTVSFADPNIKVNKVTVASPSGLLVNIRVDKGTALAPVDVTVSDGSTSEAYKGAFEIRSPLELTSVGSAAQGSILRVHARTLDFSLPFDTTATGDGLFTPLEYPNLNIMSTDGTLGLVDTVTDFTVDYHLFIDVTAPTTSLDVDIHSGPADKQVNFPYPGAFQIAARTPKPATPTTPATDKMQNPGDSLLFSYTPTSAGLKVVDLTVTSTNTSAKPGAYFLPKSGKFADILGTDGGNGYMMVSSSTEPLYAVAIDQNDFAPYTMSFTVTETDAAKGAEQEPNNDQATANGPLTLPIIIQGASLQDASDQDWYAITITANDVGKSIEAVTTGGDGYTDTVVDFFDSAGNSLGGPSSDLNYLDALTSDTLNKPGTYFVQVSASSYFDAKHTQYDVVLRVR